MPLFAISGSQGTGKTTIINELPSIFNKIERKTSRSILSDWQVSLSEVNSNPKLTLQFQEEIIKRKYQDELAAVKSDQIYVTERTYTDLFVYALFALGSDNRYSDWLNQYYDKCKMYQQQYREIFFIKGQHFIPVNDGVRATNQHYSNAVDQVMHTYTNEMSQSYQLITDGNHINRVQLITHKINLLGSNPTPVKSAKTEQPQRSVYEIYTDGACKGNPGLGGWGAYIINKTTGEKTELFGKQYSATNNQMELLAAIKGLQYCSDNSEIEIHVDSQYVKNGIESWIKNWKKNNWITSTRQPVKNQQLWIELDNQTRRHQIRWMWVKGHSGNFGNSKADALANKGAYS